MDIKGEIYIRGGFTDTLACTCINIHVITSKHATMKINLTKRSEQNNNECFVLKDLNTNTVKSVYKDLRNMDRIDR